MMRGILVTSCLVLAPLFAKAGCYNEGTEILCVPPLVSITSPASGGSYLAPASLSLAVSATDDGDRARLAKVELYRNGVLIDQRTASNAAAISFSTAVSGLSAGSYSFVARAYDGGNRSRDSNTVLATVTANQVPTTQLSAPASGSSVKSPYNGTIAVAVTGSASDSDGSIARIEVLVDGSVAANIAAASVNTSVALAPGTRRILLRAYDNSGASADSAEATVNVAGIGPVTGNVEGITNDVSGNPQLVGWACDKAAAQSIAVHLYAGGAAGAGGTMIASTTANLASEAAVSTACATSGVAHRWTIPLAAYREAQAGKTLYVHGISTIGGSNLALPQSGSYTMPAPPPGPVLGGVDGIVYDAAGNPSLNGWACDKRVNQSITVQLYANGAAGTGTLLTSTTANQASNATIAQNCATSGTAHRWSIPLAAYRATYAGKVLYVHGVSQSGGSNAQLTQSGSFSIPAADALLPVSIQPPHLANAEAGNLPAGITVSDGAVLYSLPISVPPGTAGLVPSLALGYSSRGPNGALGQGWQLTGLSTIHRCGRTLAQDGKADTVRFATTDRLCLDGQRLVLANGPATAGQPPTDASYWATNAEYRTEIESFSRITRYTGPSAGKQGFKVETREGRTLYYGLLEDSYVDGQGRSDGQAYRWALSRVEDRSGNRIDYQYDENATTGEHLLKNIRWGANTAAGLNHHAKVEFLYEDRPDADALYLAGSHIDRRKRLYAIRTYADTAADGSGGALALNYALTYVVSSTSGRSQLKQVKACDSANTCLPATTFGWGSAGVGELWQRFTSFDADPTLQPGDFNGDGRSDLLGQVLMLFDGTSMVVQPGTLDGANKLVGDFDGDGVSDYAYEAETPAPGHWQVCLSTYAKGTAGFDCRDWMGSIYRRGVDQYGKSQYRVVDFDGDGRDDIIVKTDYQTYAGALCRSTGSRFECQAGSNYGKLANVHEPVALDGETLVPERAGRPSLGDFDGDGLADIARIDPTRLKQGLGVTLEVCRGQSSGAVCQTWYQGGALSPYQVMESKVGGSLVGDFNGDGYADALFMFSSNPFGTVLTGTLFCYSTGSRFDCNWQNPPATGLPAPDAGQIADVDGDGQPELFGRSSLCRYRFGTLNCAAASRDPVGGSGDNFGRVGDFDGDGLLDLVSVGLVREIDPMQRFGLYRLNPLPEADKLVSVTDGLGNQTQVSYVRANVASTYTSAVKQADGQPLTVAWPTRRLNPSQVGPLVYTLRQGNGQGGWLENRYSYAGAMLDLQGRGQLGFALEQSTDPIRGDIQTDWNNLAWPYTGMATTSRLQIGSVILNDAVSTPGLISSTLANGQKTALPYVRQSVVTRRDLDGSALGTTTTINTYGDGWGNLTQQDVTVSGGVTGGSKTYTARTVTTYLNDATTWLIGRPDRVTASKTRDGVTMSRVIDYDYDAQGLLKTETREPTDTSLKYKLVTSYDRSANVFGLVNKKTLAWRDPASNTDKTRVIEDVTYDAKGRFPTTVKNAIGQAETRAYDPKTGVQTSLTGPNGLTTTWTVNGFGRKTKETRADGTETRYYLEQCDANCPVNATHVEIADHFKGADRIAVPSLAYRDSAGHVLRTQTYGYDGRAIVTDQRYDSRGRPWEADQPRYSADAAILASRQAYDALDRVTAVTTRDEAGTERSATTQYKGLVTIQTNAKSQSKTDERDALGLLVRSTDAKAGVTLFGRDAWGNLSQTTDPNGNVIKVTYDALGRKTDLQDPDLGLIHYDVDPLGQVWQQISPKQRAASQSTKFEFDALGRMTARYEPDLESHWVYDHATTPASCAATKSCGQLVESYTGTSTAKDYRRLHLYDSLGRPNTTTTVLDTTSYARTQAYDAWGRPSKLTVQRSGGTVKGYDNRYNALGYLARIERGSLVLWQSNAQDAANRVLQASLGNGLNIDTVYNPNTGRLTKDTLKTAAAAVRLDEGYQYDLLGNVSLRTQYWDGSTGFSETFSYDTLNRLEWSEVSGKVRQNFTYDAIGNLLSKTGAGTGSYVYPTQGATATRPHAVQSIPGIGAFAYDDNGNQTSGANRTLTWTSFDMPKKITEGSVSSEFVYGPEHQRTKQLKQDGSTVYYAGSQEAENKAGIWTIKTYWPSDLGVEIDVVNGSTTTTTLNWIHTDRLGSVIGITDQTGALKEKLAYDAWGKRRSLDGATTLDTLDGVVDNKGFTGHEMLDGLDLVHMNGRVYDPLVARFISADPIIQAPYYSQSYNRYSYVWNNPTNLTDPSGYRADQLVEQVPERIEIAGQRLAEQRIEVVGQCLRLCQVKRGLRELARVKGTMAAGEVAGGTLAARWAAAGPAVRMGAPVLVAAAPPVLGAAAACVRSVVCGVAVAVGAYFTYEILTKDDAEADAESLNAGGTNTEDKKRGQGKDNQPKSDLPRDESGNYVPHPDAEGPHTTIGTRPGSKGGSYTQGATFGENGKFEGRTDVTDHGRPQNHPNPHWHPATGPNSVGNAEPIRP